MSESKTSPVAMLAVALAIGISLVGNSVWRLFIHPTNLDAFTSTANGTITSVHTRYSDGDKYYRPTITFEDSDHLTHEAASVVEYSRKPYKGTEVTVRYDPYHPDDGCII